MEEGRYCSQHDQGGVRVSYLRRERNTHSALEEKYHVYVMYTLSFVGPIFIQTWLSCLPYSLFSERGLERCRMLQFNRTRKLVWWPRHGSPVHSALYVNHSARSVSLLPQRDGQKEMLRVRPPDIFVLTFPTKCLESRSDKCSR